MLINYKYKWNKKHAKFTKFEKNRKGIVYKEILSNNNDYIIIKYISKDIDSYKANTVKYKVKIWLSGHYKALYLCNNPRQAINYIKKHSKYIGVCYA